MQLSLPVRLADEASFANFFPHPPVAATVAQLRAALERADAGILLHGPGGSGRSHLLQACCHEAEARGQTIVYLPLAELLELPPAELLSGLEVAELVCLDDLDAVAGRAAWDEALFHLLNQLALARARLLVAARVPPVALPAMLPDLRSRLQALLVLALAAPDEPAMLEVLRLRSHNRGLVMSPEVARYILQRAPRDTTALIEVLDRLDRCSLEAGRRLSIPFVREVMDWQS